MPYRAQVVLPYRSNMPEDVITNTLYFQSTALDLAAAAALWTPRIATFYEEAYGGGLGIATYIADDALCHVNWYDTDDPPPRAPLTVPLGQVFPLRTISAIPSEVACVLSFQGTPVSGQPQARRRGRIYLGALTGNWLSGSVTTAPPTFASGIPQVVADAAEANLLTPGDADDFWVVYSQTAPGWTTVSNGWVDNTPDTQRRRGVQPTLRVVYP